MDNTYPPQTFGKAQVITVGFLIYVCPQCGNTIKWPKPSTSAPYLTCWHGDEPHQMTICYQAGGNV